MVVAEGRAPRVWTDELAGRFALQINEVGGALRRTLALFFERQATAKGFTARRVTVTNPDGSESSDVLVLTDVERDLLESRVSTVVESLAEDLGSIEAARRSLLAWLVTPPRRMRSAATSTATSKPREGTRMSDIRHICGISGGKDSSALAVYLRDRVPEMEYFFCDTGAELPETYEYLDRLETALGKPIARLNSTQGVRPLVRGLPRSACPPPRCAGAPRR